MSLPPDEVVRLAELRNDLPQLRLRVRRLRQSGWTLASIAEALQTYRSTVRVWAVHPSHAETLRDDVPIPPVLAAMPVLGSLDPSRFPVCALPRLGLANLAPRLHVTTVRHLGELSHSARRVRGHTASTASSRLAATKFDAILALERTRGVTVQELADAAKLTSRAIRARLPASLPPQLPLTDSPCLAPSFYVLVSQAPSGSRKWRTFVIAGTEIPVAFPASLIELPTIMPTGHHVLSTFQALAQLGWHNVEQFPEPI